MKAPVRSRSIGTKVTEEEYARLEAQAAEKKQSLSEWSREAMLSVAESGTGTSAEQTLLAEVLALRTILVNLFFQLSQGEPIAPEQMKSILERADAGKREKALAKLQPAKPEPEKMAATAAAAVQ